MLFVYECQWVIAGVVSSFLGCACDTRWLGRKSLGRIGPCGMLIFMPVLMPRNGRDCQINRADSRRALHAADALVHLFA